MADIKVRQKRLVKHSINEELCGTAHGLASVVGEIQTHRHRILEEFALAFLAETDLAPSEVVLIEKRAPKEIRWYFEKRQPRKK